MMLTVDAPLSDLEDYDTALREFDEYEAVLPPWGDRAVTEWYYETGESNAHMLEATIAKPSVKSTSQPESATHAKVSPTVLMGYYTQSNTIPVKRPLTLRMLYDTTACDGTIILQGGVACLTARIYRGQRLCWMMPLGTRNRSAMGMTSSGR